MRLLADRAVPARPAWRPGRLPVSAVSDPVRPSSPVGRTVRATSAPAGIEISFIMTQPSVQRAGSTELFSEIVGVAQQIAAMLEALPSTDIAIPHATWTVGEAAAHLAMANGHMAQIAADHKPDRYGDGTGAGLAEANRRALEVYDERDGAALARQIEQRAQLFVQAAQTRPAEDLVDTPLGSMRLGTLGGYLLAHMLSHGTAIADALRRPLPIRPSQVELMVPFLVGMMPVLARESAVAGVHLRYEVRLRGSVRFTALIADGTVTVDDPAARPIDCVISAEPVAFFLLAMGLRPQWPMIVTGKIRAWGRRPWLGPRFVGFFAFP